MIIKSFIDFLKDGGLMLAGSLSYFTIMAFVPFCLFLITLFGSFLGHYQQFYQFFLNKLISFFPEITSEVTKELEKLITFRGIGTFSIVLYGILSYQVFASLENALNVIFKIKKRRSFLWSIILSSIIVTIIINIILLSFLATSLIPLLKTLKPFFPALKIGKITSFLIRYVVPFFMIFFIVTVLYILIPRKKVKISHALFGALFTTTFLEVAKHLFTWYVGTVVRFGTIYGSLTAFVVFLLWMFYSSCIFLIGAEVVHNQGNYRR
ncbi:MAG: YihY/virulence factor BrkB family protein [Nitrospirota bacterium]